MENSVLEHIQNTYGKFLTDGNSVLHIISALGFPDALEELLKCSYDMIDSQNDLGWTPLMQAARNGHTECILILLKANANIFCRNFYGLDARVIASASGNLDCVKILERFCEKTNTFDTVIGSVSVAVLYQNYDILKFLLQTYPLRANEATDIGLTPLMYAAAIKDTDAIEILYSFNADKHFMNIRNETAKDILHKRFFHVLLHSETVNADILANSKIKDSETFQIYNRYKNKLEQSIKADMSKLAVVEEKIRRLSHSSGILSPLVESPKFSPIVKKDCSSIKFKKSPGLEHFIDNEEQVFFPKHFSNGAAESTSYKYFQNNVSAVLNKSFCKDLPHSNSDLEDDVFFDNNEESVEKCTILPDSEKKYAKIICALRGTNLQKYIPMFLKEEIDTEVFLSLNNEDLLFLGIFSENDRNDILKMKLNIDISDE